MATHAALILDWQLFTETQRSALFRFRVPEILSVITDVLTAGHFTRYDLQATDLGDVFYRLNMDPPEHYRNRSMSVGDVVIDLRTNTALVCAPTGWIELPAVPPNLKAA